MVLLAAAICSAPPALVPELTQAAASELDELRAACDAAVADLLRCNASRLVVVAAGTSTRTYSAAAPAGWHRLGVARAVPPLDLAVSTGEPLPLALTVGRWLLGAPLVLVSGALLLLLNRRRIRRWRADGKP